MYAAHFIAPGMWAVAKDDDFLAARLFDTREDASAAAASLNALGG